MGLTRTLLVAGAGAALAYFLDPVSGKERRRKLREYWDERLPGSEPAKAEPAVVVERQAAPRTSAK
jgi:hypothetical protein